MSLTYTSAAWARVANTTIRDYIRTVENAIMRKRVVLALLRKRGLIVRNCGGDGFSWIVKYRRAPMQTNDGEQPLDFSRQLRHENAHLDYAGYAVTDQFTLMEKLKNKTNAAIVSFVNNTAKELMDDIEDQFAEELYVDVDGTGNSERWSGLDTMFASTQTIELATGAARTANAADPVGYPNDTYAGLSTVLANKGGTWGSGDINSTWPYGVGASEQAAYDYFSPVIVNYTSTAFGGATWVLNSVKATRFGIDAINSRNKSKFGKCDVVLLDRGLNRQYRDALDSKERKMITSSNEMTALGFGGEIEQDGAVIMSEYGVPASKGYGLTVNAMELRTMQDRIFVPRGPDESFDNQTWRSVVNVFGQWRFHSPRHYFQLKSMA